MITSTITSKGQTTIPQAVREALGVDANDRIAYDFADGTIVLRPIKGGLLNLRGSITPKHRPEDFKAIRRHVAKAVAKAAVARNRAREPRESLRVVQRRLIRSGKLRG